MHVLDVITACRLERGWTERQLAERSDITQSTISAWYSKHTYPTLPSLEKICAALGITLSQFFCICEEEATVTLTSTQHKLINNWAKLEPEQQEILFALIDNMNRQAK